MFIKYQRIYKVFKRAILLRFCIILTLYFSRCNFNGIYDLNIKKYKIVEFHRNFATMILYIFNRLNILYF